MQRTTFKLDPKASISLNSMLKRQTRRQFPLVAAMSAGLTANLSSAIRKTDLVSVFVESTDAEKAASQIKNLTADERLEPLSDHVLAARVSLDTVREILKRKNVARVQTKKRMEPHLDKIRPDTALFTATGTRQVVE